MGLVDANTKPRPVTTALIIMAVCLPIGIWADYRLRHYWDDEDE